MSWKRLAGIALSAACLAVPVVADAGVDAGSDVWNTPGDGTSFVDFADDPIPAGFFCTGSAAFSGTIALKGKPLATNPAAALRGADTVVVRPDDASFGSNFAAYIVALSLEGTTGFSICGGSWTVLVYARSGEAVSVLAAQQTGAGGGTFGGTLVVPATVRFTKGATVRELDRDVDFLIPSDSEWTFEPGGDGWVNPAATVDTDADGSPDTAIPAGSNFFPGWSQFPVSGLTAAAGCSRPPCRKPVRHEAPRHRHVVQPPLPPCRIIIVQPSPSPTPTAGTRPSGGLTIDDQAPAPVPGPIDNVPAPIPCSGNPGTPTN
jgi:hypothetical protein